MKLVIDEKLKHRLIGIAVIVSIGAIFAPAIMKKSSQNYASNYSVRVKLPAKPTEPQVAVKNEQELFRTIKVAKVDLPAMKQESKAQLAQTEALRVEKLVAHEAVANAVVPTVTQVQLANLSSDKPIMEKAKLAATTALSKAPNRPQMASKKPILKPLPTKPAQVVTRGSKGLRKADIYAIQLASFSQLKNAQALVNRLHSKGYKANFARVSTRQGVAYKVYAGHSKNRNDVLQVKSQLASSMQLKGFVVNTGVS